MTRFQTSQALSILMSLALVVTTWLPTISLPATGQVMLIENLA
ncbi:MAG: hypothetical protein ACKOPQ_08235 [Novosphingobium sp.]